MTQHYSGQGSKYTSQRMPVELVFAGEFDRIADAYAFERQVQGWSRAKREALIAGQFNRLPGLSKKRFTPMPGIRE
jgi:putative endonuclease